MSNGGLQKVSWLLFLGQGHSGIREISFVREEDKDPRRSAPPREGLSERPGDSPMCPNGHLLLPQGEAVSLELSLVSSCLPGYAVLTQRHSGPLP